MRIFKFSIFLLLVLFSCQEKNRTIDARINERGLVANESMVVCANPYAAEIGKTILKNGGTAFDAAIAVEFALSVCHPSAGNIGGGGFMVLRDKDGNTESLDYREVAPAAASKDMFLDKDKNPIKDMSIFTHKSSGVPGTVDGMFNLYNKYGTLPFNELIQPAIDLARKGFVLSDMQVNRLNSLKSQFVERNNNIPAYVNDSLWKHGDSLKLENLAKTLERIRDNGRNGFYSGETADLIVNEMKRGNGLISYEDLKNYSSVWRKPVSAKYKDFKVISMGPPSSGGVCLIQLLQMIEEAPLSSLKHNETDYIHYLAEAERRVYADRAYFLGDPDFWLVPVNELIDKKYAVNRFSDFNPEKATKSTEISHGNITGYESDETTHYSIIDKYGNAVSATTTLNLSYGSRIVVDGAGFILNNEMDDFSLKPGSPNSYGLVGGEANSIQAGKRMLSSMTPTIILQNDKLYMVIGSPGGSKIITSVFQSILNVIEFDMTMQEAVSSPRFHHQWLPDVIFYETAGIDSLSIKKLQDMDYSLEETNPFCRVDAILVLPDGRLEGGADPRGDDVARGN